MSNELITETMRTWQQTAATNITEGLSSAESVTASYVHVPARTFNSTTQAMTEGSNVTIASLPVHQLANAHMPSGKTGVPAGGVVFVVTVARMTAGSVTEPTERDRITVSGITYRVAKWEQDPASLRWYLLCFKVGT